MNQGLNGVGLRELEGRPDIRTRGTEDQGRPEVWDMEAKRLINMPLEDKFTSYSGDQWADGVRYFRVRGWGWESL
tara:strand:- start:120 stop:344 length:225 start_codon:yes stop_codon:yes gene_type:complete